MKSKALLSIMVALLLALTAGTAWAVGSPDRASFTNISTSPSSTVNGQNHTLTADVYAGDTITVSFNIGASGTGPTSTTYADTLNLTASTNVGPAPVTVTGLTNCTLTVRTATPCSETATITVPATLGTYQIKVLADDGRTGTGKMNSDFFFVNFTVVAPPCNPVQTTLVLSTPACAVLHANSVTLSATLTAGGSGLEGQTIHFYVDGNEVGIGTTDSYGTATYNYDPSGLAIGDHALSAAFTSGDTCDYYDSTATGGKLGIDYLFLGYQQPINADGSSIFKGNTIPVKIKITDANGALISDAAPEVYIWLATSQITGTDPENVASGLNFDHGYVMRYDPTANQYVYNMDLGTVTNGTNTIQVYLGDGTACAAQHQASVSVQKKK